MKILTLVWSIGVGGTERAAVNYAIGYKKFEMDSRVLVLGEGHERYTDLKEAGVQTTLLARSLKNKSKIIDELKKWSPDIIHVHNYSQGLSSYVNLLKGIQTKVVETNVFSRPNFNACYKDIHLSMQLSAWGHWKYTRLMKGSSYSPEVAIVPYIVDTVKFQRPAKKTIDSFLHLYDIPSDAYVIGRLGQPHMSKWDMRILKVIKHTVHPENNIYFLLVGVPDKMMSALNEETDFFKTRVRTIDKILGDENLSLYYHSLQCFAHISKIGESFGYVLAEALSCKVPVVTMLTPLRDNAQFEVVGHEYGGFCVTNVSEFITAVKMLYHNEKLTLSIRGNLGDWVESRFSYNMIVPKQLQLYKLLLAGKKLPVENVSGIVQANINSFRGRYRAIRFLSKFINNSIMNAFIQLKNLPRTKLR